MGDGGEIKRNLYSYVNDRISEFSIYYQAALPGSLQIDPQDALSSFRSLLIAVQQAGYPLYLLVDEYDNFANELMMGHQSTEESRYQAILSGEGCMKALFKTVKATAGEQGLGKVFITGVSPVAMNNLTSAYNMAKNIYLQARFNDLCGFRETEIAAMAKEIARECDLPQSDADEAFSMIRTFYNGCRFSRRAEHTYL